MQLRKNEQPLSTSGNTEEMQEQLGGTTNLSLEQLKKEGGSNAPQQDMIDTDDHSRDDGISTGDLRTEND